MEHGHTTAKFIVIEGIDSQVIEQQAESLYSWLRDERLPVHLTREPSDGPFGSQIRFILDGRLDVDRVTLALFFATDRMDHLNKEGGIIQTLDSGEHVICVRYYLSSLAYEAVYADFTWLRWINAKCRAPDLTVFVDMPINSCIEQLHSGVHEASTLEQERARLNKVWENYVTAIEVLRADQENVVIVEGNRPSMAVAKDVMTHVLELMEHDRECS